MIKIFGICGSPIKGGNTERFLREALKAAEETGEAQTQIVTLAGKSIKDCRHCNWCVRKQEEDKYCAIEDDVTREIFPKILEADGILLATPVYIGRLSGYLANLVDRFRAFMFGKFYRGVLRDKVGGALAVGWYRNMGAETALLSINCAFLMFEMIPTSVHNAAYGGVGLSSFGGTGRFDPRNKLIVLEDDLGLRNARAIVKRMVELIKIIKAGKEALKHS